MTSTTKKKKKEEEEENDSPQKEDDGTRTSITESKTKTTTEEDNQMEKAIIAFLQHPSIASLPTSMKVSYLETKGLPRNHIQKAIESTSTTTPTTATTTTTTATATATPEYNPGVSSSYYPSPHHLTPPEPPNAMVPITVGAFLALFGMASYRWLIHGDDFILFPTTTTATRIADDHRRTTPNYNDSSMEHEMTPTLQSQELVVSSSEEEEVEEEEVVEVDELCLELKGLHQTIQEYLKNQQEKERTNRTMDLLVRQQQQDDHKNQTTNTNTNTKKNNDSAAVLQVQVQLMEIKCLLHQLSFQLTTTTKTNNHDDDPEHQDSQNTIQSSLQQIQDSLQQIQNQFQTKPSNPTNPTKTDAQNNNNNNNNNKNTTNNNTTNNPTTTNLPLTLDDTNNTNSNINRNDNPIITNKPSSTTSTVKQEIEEPEEVLIVPPTMEKVSAALKDFMELNAEDEVKRKGAAQMLYLYIYNLANNPSVSRYQKIFTNNANFNNKIQNAPGALSILTSVGFVQKKSNCFEYPASILQDAIPLLQDTAASLSLLQKNNNNTINTSDIPLFNTTITTTINDETNHSSQIQ